MDVQEAREILEAHLAHYQASAYEELAALVGAHGVAMVGGASGAQYCVEVEVSWDDPSRRTIRVLVSVDGGGARGLVPMSVDCIVAPDSPSGVEE